MKQGIMFLGIDESRSEPDWDKGRLPNPYRTGHMSVVKREAVERMRGGMDECGNKALDWALERGWLFIEYEAGCIIGIFKKEEWHGRNEAGADQQGPIRGDRALLGARGRRQARPGPQAGHDLGRVTHEAEKDLRAELRALQIEEDSDGG